MIGSKARATPDSNSLLKALGLPTHKDDAWKYSELSRFSFDDFLPVTRLKNPTLPEALRSLVLCPKDTFQIIFYNGQLVEISKLLTKINSHNADSIGAQLIIPENYSVEKPIFIFHVLATKDTPIWINLRNSIVLKASSQAKIVEMFITVGEKSSFTHMTSKIQIGEHAHLDHVYCQQSLSPTAASTSSTHLLIGQVEIETELYSKYIGTSITQGGNLNRAAFQIEAKGSYSNTQFYSLQMPKNHQQMDTHLTLRHQDSDFAESFIMARGVVDHQARGAFTGKIIIERDAYQTKASLENKNLLLSEHAEMNTRPQLEVYSDEVQHCSHGATVGHLDKDALFYLQSRGIPEIEAKEMLVEAFITPSLQGIPLVLKPFVEGLIHEQ